MTPHLRLVPLPSEDLPLEAAPAGADIGLLAFVLAVHLVPLAALAAGRPWGAGTVGYATAVALISGREVVRELAARSRAGRASA